MKFDIDPDRKKAIIEWLKKVVGIIPKYVCGMCGAHAGNRISECANGHKHWVCLDDLHDPDKQAYISECRIDRETLRKLLRG